MYQNTKYIWKKYIYGKKIDDNAWSQDFDIYIKMIFKKMYTKVFCGLNVTILIDVLTCQMKIPMICLLNRKSLDFFLQISNQKVSRYTN